MIPHHQAAIDAATGHSTLNVQFHKETLYRKLPHPDQPGKWRKARRKPVDELFGIAPVPTDEDDEKPKAKSKKPPPEKTAKEIEAVLDNFVSQDFADRLRRQMQAEQAADPTLTPAGAVLRAAASPLFGPRGIGKISVWDGKAAFDEDDLHTVPRGNHSAVVDAQQKAWVDIVAGPKGWQAVPVAVIDCQRHAAKPANLVMRLRKGDCIAWDGEDGRRMIVWLKIIRKDGGLYVWPLRVAPDLAAAQALGFDMIPNRDGISATAGTLQKRNARPVTITPLGRLRDPGPFGKRKG